MGVHRREVKAVLSASKIDDFVDELFAQNTKGLHSRSSPQQVLDVLRLTLEVGGDVSAIVIGVKTFLDLVDTWRNRGSDPISATIDIEGHSVTIGGDEWQEFVTKQLNG